MKQIFQTDFFKTALSLCKNLRQSSLLVPGVFFLISSPTAVKSFYLLIGENRYILCAAAFVCWIIFLLLVKAAAQSGKCSRIILLILFIFGLLEEVHLSIMGEPLTLDTLLFLWSERNFAGEAFHTYWRFGATSVVLYAFLIVLLFGKRKKVLHANSRNKYLTAAGMIYILLSGMIISGIINPRPEILPPPLAIPIIPVSMISLPSSAQAYAEEKIPQPGPGLSDKLIFIIDESIRGDFIDINTMQDTTPYIYSIRDTIINFGIASSAANSSNSSNAVLRFGLKPEQITSRSRENMFRRASLFRLAKKAGYATTYIDCQKESGLQNYMTPGEQKDIDTFIQTNKLRTGKIKGDESFNDTNAAKKANEILKQNGKQFILINKKGCHFHYARSFPETQKIFQPCMVWEEPVNSREKLINTYKNGIRWSVDTFFKILLENNDLHDVTVFYTSDHGQNLLDDGKPATHCRYRTATVNEAKVPLFIITGNKSAENKLRESTKANLNRATHFQINATVLSFMGYPLDFAESRSGKSLFREYTDRRFFFAGNIRYGRPIEIGFE